MIGIENLNHQTNPLRSRDNIYDYRSSPAGKMTKLPIETSSLRSPSSLGVTTTTTNKSTGSQSSLKSAISLKETSTPVNTHKDINKYTERLVDELSSQQSQDSKPSSKSSYKYDDSKNLLGNYDKRSREYLTQNSNDGLGNGSSGGGGGRSKTPIPASRSTLKSSRTHLIEGVPQTEV